MNCDIPQLDGGRYDDDEDFVSSDVEESSSDELSSSDDDEDGEEGSDESSSQSGRRVSLRSKENETVKENRMTRGKGKRTPKISEKMLEMQQTANETAGKKRRGRPRKSDAVETPNKKDEETEKLPENTPTLASVLCSKCKKSFEHKQAFQKHIYWCASSRFTRSKTGDKNVLKKRNERKKSSSFSSPQKSSEAAPKNSSTPTKGKRGRPRKNTAPELQQNNINVVEAIEEEAEEEQPSEQPKGLVSLPHSVSKVVQDDPDVPALCPKCGMRYRNAQSLQKHLPTCAYSSSGSSSEDEQAEDERENADAELPPQIQEEPTNHVSELIPQMESTEIIDDTQPTTEINNTQQQQVIISYQEPAQLSQSQPEVCEQIIIPPKTPLPPEPPLSLYATQNANLSSQEHHQLPINRPIQQRQQPQEFNTVTFIDSSTGQLYRMNVPMSSIETLPQAQQPSIPQQHTPLLQQPQIPPIIAAPPTQPNPHQLPHHIQTLNQNHSSSSHIHPRSSDLIQQQQQYQPNNIPLLNQHQFHHNHHASQSLQQQLQQQFQMQQLSGQFQTFSQTHQQQQSGFHHPQALQKSSDSVSKNMLQQHFPSMQNNPLGTIFLSNQNQQQLQQTAQNNFMSPTYHPQPHIMEQTQQQETPTNLSLEQQIQLAQQQIFHNQMLQQLQLQNTSNSHQHQQAALQQSQFQQQFAMRQHAHHPIPEIRSSFIQNSIQTQQQPKLPQTQSVNNTHQIPFQTPSSFSVEKFYQTHHKLPCVQNQQQQQLRLPLTPTATFFNSQQPQLQNNEQIPSEVNQPPEVLSSSPPPPQPPAVQLPSYHLQLPPGFVIQQQPTHPQQSKIYTIDKYRKVLTLPRPIEPKPAELPPAPSIFTAKKALNIKSQLAQLILEKNHAAAIPVVASNQILQPQSQNADINGLRKAPVLTAVVRPMEHPLQKLSDQISQIESIFNGPSRQTLATTPDLVQTSEIPTPLSQMPPPSTQPILKRKAPATANGRNAKSIKVTLKRREGGHSYSINDVSGGAQEGPNVQQVYKSLKIKTRVTSGELAGTLTEGVIEPKIHIIPIPGGDDCDGNVTVPEGDSPVIPSIPLGGDSDPNAVQKLTRRAVVVYEVKIGDAVRFQSSDVRAIWSHIFETAQGNRLNHALPPLPYPATNITLENKQEPSTTFNIGGLTHRAIEFLLMHLPKKNLEARFKELPPPILDNDGEVKETLSGCARTEGYKGRKPFDMFGWLASKHRKPLEIIPAGGEEVWKPKQGNIGMPIASRYRTFKEKTENSLTVMWSTIHGRGLYTRRDIDRGEMVIEYAGEVIRSPVCDQREKFYETKGIGCYMFRIDDEYIIDATLKGNAARFINHSCEPNCESKTVQIRGSQHIVIFALRRISAGEELTYDYKFEKEDNKIPCACASRRCRKYLN